MKIQSEINEMDKMDKIHLLPVSSAPLCHAFNPNRSSDRSRFFSFQKGKLFELSNDRIGFNFRQQ